MIVIRAVAKVTARSLDPVVEEVREIRSRSLERAGVIGYDFFQQDADHVIAVEVYDDCDVLVAHIDAGGFDGLFELIEIERIELMGPVTPEVRARFEALGNVAIHASLTEPA